MKQMWHPWTEWECYRAGMFDGPTGMSPEEATQAYADFLSDIPRFQRAMDRVLKEWPISCEQFLSNPNINRIAWLGQASMCIETGVPRTFRAGFNLLDIDQRTAANNAAADVLKQWLKNAKADQSLREAVEVERLSSGHTGRSATGFDAQVTSPVLQSDSHSDPEERYTTNILGIQPSKVKVVQRIEADRNSPTK